MNETPLSWHHGLKAEEYTVIVTRSPDQVRRLAASLAQLGGQVYALPLIHVDLQPSLATVDCLRSAGQADVLVATSANAMKALANVAEYDGVVLPNTCYVIGQGSARMARDLGFAAVHFEQVKTGLQLVQHLAEVLPPRQRILFPHGNLADPKLLEVLRRAGHQVFGCPCYTTRDAEISTALWEQAFERQPVYLVLYSPSAARSLHRQWLARGQSEKFGVVCIGTTTAAECERLGLHVSKVAREPTDAGVLDAITQLMRETR